MAKIDQEFYEALVAKGFDVSQMGLIPGEEGALEKALAPGNKALNPVEDLDRKDSHVNEKAGELSAEDEKAQ